VIIALSGGVGGAKLALGLARVMPPEELVVIVNTGDDFEHFGLHISPDPDTVMYTLAGLADRERGWGRADETWHFMDALKALGGDTWFALGDKDLATHIERTRRLKSGESLSVVMRDLSRSLGVAHAIAPMSDDAVRTKIVTRDGPLAFQDYFVRLRCEPPVRAITFEGAEHATPGALFEALMRAPKLSGIVICPSNPLLSIAPILSIPGVRQWLERRRVPAVAVSPIVGGKAVKGPAAKIMTELGMKVSVRGIADYYEGLIDGLVIDSQDKDAMTRGGGLATLATDSIMRDEDGRRRLAREVVAFMETLSRRRSR
jgi:LPPG:FO 2-phospho-L-lactate transferase